MASTVTILLDALIAALRTGGAFADVGLSPAGNATAVPRASVCLDGTETFASDAVAGETWCRARVTVDVHTRDTDAGQAVRRLQTLLDAAEAALLVDPSQGGLCRALPVGQATEIVSRQLSPAVHRPQAAATLSVRCHFVSTGGA